MTLPEILTDKEILSSHIQEVRKMGMNAREEGKSYKLCTEDSHLDEYVEAFCIYSPFMNNIIRNILYENWWKGYKMNNNMKAKDWISTKDRLPETNNKIDNYINSSDEVLICLNGNEVVTGRFYKDYDCITYWVSSFGYYKYHNGLVTHWMEIVLPENKQK